MRPSFGVLGTACVLSAAFLVVGCAGGTDSDSRAGEEIYDPSVLPVVRVAGVQEPYGGTASQAVPEVEPEPVPEVEPEAVPEVESGPFAFDEIGPLTVPEIPDLPDGGGLIPDAPDASDETDSIFASPVDVFGG